MDVIVVPFDDYLIDMITVMVVVVRRRRTVDVNVIIVPFDDDLVNFTMVVVMMMVRLWRTSDYNMVVEPVNDHLWLIMHSTMRKEWREISSGRASNHRFPRIKSLDRFFG